MAEAYIVEAIRTAGGRWGGRTDCKPCTKGAASLT